MTPYKGVDAMGQNIKDMTGMIDRNPNSNEGGVSMSMQGGKHTPNGKPMPMHSEHPPECANKGASMKPPTM